MWPYWFMYAIPALAAVSDNNRERSWVPWLVLGLFFTLCIGFRFQVGGDWGNYLPYYDKEIGKALTAAITDDPGYILLNRLMAQLDWKIYGVNLACGLLFTCGLIVFCRGLYRSWLGFAIAVPYLVIVVAMGYSRQGVALGLIFFGLAYLEQGKFTPYVLFIAFAALFHQTAIIMIPLGIFLYRQGWLYRIIAVLLIVAGLWDALVVDDIDNLWTAYVEQQMHSQGAVIRVAMNATAAVVLLRYWKQWKQVYPNALFWLWMAFGAIACVAVVGFATTAVDRLALYLTPLQVVVFSRLPFLARKQLHPDTLVKWILLGYGVVLFVWLHFATHAQYWLPYRNILFE
ncbi:MAG: EpsG family protein [Candidatus Electrothrix sp. MAN1_4]|nr:EpsG family protein [Candidatus Electrothrix sp. MAN1_4]